MSDTIVLALAQFNPTVGAVEKNGAMVRAARAIKADLLVCSELVISGYPPEDLLYRPAFLDQVRAEVESLAAQTADGGPAVLLGAPWRDEDGQRRNAALLLAEGRIVAIRYKRHLPNYGVFDEARVFVPAPVQAPVPFRNLHLGVLVCEDMWYPDGAASLVQAGADILIVLNGSPFDANKHRLRHNQAMARVRETARPLVYINQVGGQDELVFDGASFVLGSDQSVRMQAPFWREAVMPTVWRNAQAGWTCRVEPPLPPAAPEEDIYQAMMLGVRDYVTKNGFPGVLLGLSGGIDSALSAAVAVDALGAEKVRGVMMPSPYTSRESLEDAALVARFLGMTLDTVPIAPAMQAFGAMLAPFAGDHPPGITGENIQARARGLTLMALSNTTGAMVLSTGNKSEMSVGYATLYGDMCGGYSVLKDVYKTTVFAVARWRNRCRPAGGMGPEGMVMPERVLTKVPTAELKPDQTDQDTLPPYADLDAMLMLFIEDEMSVADVIGRGFDAATVQKVWRMLNQAEYKRRQAPPGVKITPRAFGRERRYPITHGYV